MSTTKSELKRAVQQVAVEGGGLVAFDAVRSRDIPLLVAKTFAGSQEARTLLQAVEHALGKIKHVPQHRPMLCAGLPRCAWVGHSSSTTSPCCTPTAKLGRRCQVSR